jgi:GAF domain-containing protein
MNTTQWLRAADCSLLHDGEAPDPAGLRLTHRLLELCLNGDADASLARSLLEEIGAALQADSVLVLEATPQWPVRYQFGRRAAKAISEPLPRSFLGEVLDRTARACQPPESNSPAYLAVCLHAQQVLLASRRREEFTPSDLDYAVAAGHYLGLVLEKIQRREQERQECDRLKALVHISEQLIAERETVPLLEHIAEQASRLLRCERASIFLWDQSRKELVGRPALGLPNGELRIPDHAGVVG